MAVFLARMVMPRSRSSSLESITRSTTASLARKAPLCRSMASTRVVLPWSTCAMVAILRMLVFKIGLFWSLPLKGVRNTTLSGNAFCCWRAVGNAITQSAQAMAGDNILTIKCFNNRKGRQDNAARFRVARTNALPGKYLVDLYPFFHPDDLVLVVGLVALLLNGDVVVPGFNLYLHRRGLGQRGPVDGDFGAF